MFVKAAIIIALTSVLIYFLRQHFTSEDQVSVPEDSSFLVDIDEETPRLFSKEELAPFVDEKELYLGILGHVFDVTKGKAYYKRGETYHCFVGRDGTRAFVSGNFTEGLIEDIDDVTGQEVLELNNWLDFYKSRYPFKGHIIGRFYDSNGTPTKYWHNFQEKLRGAQENNDELMKEKLKYPPCNVAWSQDQGTRVWCSTKSGGIERDWAGVPRKLYKPGQESFRCACINMDAMVRESNNVRQGNLEAYENCHPKATSCYVNPDDES